MSVILYVWAKEGINVGHAALKIGQHYASFWPAENLQGTSIKNGVESATHDHIISDMRIEGRRPQAIQFNHLDEAKMLAAFQEVKNSQYHLVNMNCSTVAARLLEVGSGRAPSFSPEVHPREYRETMSGMIDQTRLGQGRITRALGGSDKIAGVFADAIVQSQGPFKSWNPEQLWAYGQELAKAEALRQQQGVARGAPPGQMPGGGRSMSTLAAQAWPSPQDLMKQSFGPPPANGPIAPGPMMSPSPVAPANQMVPPNQMPPPGTQPRVPQRHHSHPYAPEKTPSAPSPERTRSKKPHPPGHG